MPMKIKNNDHNLFMEDFGYQNRFLRNRTISKFAAINICQFPKFSRYKIQIFEIEIISFKTFYFYFSNVRF